jgi:hypothetical protein
VCTYLVDPFIFDVCRYFLKYYEHFSKPFKFKAAHSAIRAKQKLVRLGMLDLAIQALACLGLFTLPFVFMGYVRSHVQHALRAVGEVN